MKKHLIFASFHEEHDKFHIVPWETRIKRELDYRQIERGFAFEKAKTRELTDPAEREALFATARNPDECRRYYGKQRIFVREFE